MAGVAGAVDAARHHDSRATALTMGTCSSALVAQPVNLPMIRSRAVALLRSITSLLPLRCRRMFLVLLSLSGSHEHNKEAALPGDHRALVALLRSDSVEAQERAALGNLVHIDVDNQVAIVSAGAIEPLVALVRGGSAVAQEKAAWTLGNLATTADSHVAIAQAGAIEPLVALMRGGNPAARGQAAWTLGYLARNEESKVSIAQAGAIEPLVALVRSGSAEAQEKAAWTLGNLAHNAENQVAIVSAGAIGPLVALLRGGSARAREQAVSCPAQTPGYRVRVRLGVRVDG